MASLVVPDTIPSHPPFEEKTYNITDTACQFLCVLTTPLHFMTCCPGVLGTKTLVLGKEEAVLSVKCCGICDVTTRRPYGELGSVDENKCLGCCVGVQSGLSAKGLPICPGSGCETDLVSEIVQELKARMKERGDTGQIKRSEEAVKEIRQLKGEVTDLRNDVKAIMEHFNIESLPPSTLTMDRDA